MRPFDPRLMQYAAATRKFLVLSVLFGAIQAGLIVVQAYLLATTISEVFLDRAALAEVSTRIGWLVAVLAARALVSYGAEVMAFRAAADAKSQLRIAVLRRMFALGPLGLPQRSTAEVSQLVTRGVDALDAYFGRYLPQLVLAVVVPLTVGIAILTQDLLAAVIIAVTIPLIPLFMVLIGLYTKAQVDRQWRTLGMLSGYFLDLVAGLPTLKVFGRAKAQAAQLREVGERYRKSTMGVLRVSFLSALVLELLATLSVAVVAVSIGLRLVEGNMALVTALFVLILAPEAYLPVRQVGVHFHAAAEGVGAAEDMFAILETPLPERAVGPAPDPTGAALVMAAVRAGYPGRDRPVLDSFSARFEPGRITAVVGPSGGGKTTVLRVLLGFLPVQSGIVSVQPPGAEPVDLAGVDPDAWRARVSWVPQDPVLLPGSIADNVALGCPGADRAAVVRALAGAGLPVADLPQGLDTPIREGGAGLSAGQARRVAVARALLRDTPVLLLDEPTASLDPITETSLVGALRNLAERGRTVVVVAHRRALVEAADDVVVVEGQVAGLADQPDGRAASTNLISRAEPFR